MNDFIYKRLLKERIIWPGAQVAEENANTICAQMLLLTAEDPDSDIYLYINSPGGSITAGMVIYDIVQYIKPDVATVTMGMTASMGQFLLATGAKGKRFVTPHARILMHQPLGGVQGAALKVWINADLILVMKDELAQITVEHTGHTLEETTRDANHGHWYTTQKALEYGFIDAVMENAEAVKKRE